MKRTAREDVQLLARKLVPRRETRPKVLRDHLFGRVCEPVSQLECRIVAEVAVGEDLEHDQGTVNGYGQAHDILAGIRPH